MTIMHDPITGTLESTVRAKRRAALQRATGLGLAGIILEYGLILDEHSDPVEVILDFEHPCDERSRSGAAKRQGC